MTTSRPTDDDVTGEQVVVRNVDRISEELLTSVRRPAGHARAKPECARSQQEGLHRGKDGASEQKVRRGGKGFYKEHRRELACTVMQLVGRSILAGDEPVFTVVGSRHPVHRLDDLERSGSRLCHDGSHLWGPQAR
jgi:hypothetical protein